MPHYDRNRYEENLDEYETDDDHEEGDEEEQAEEHPLPPKETLDFLQFRQRVKESIRKKNMKKNGSARNSLHKDNITPKDNYGSFFGRSEPVISQRVIQESKSLLENKHLAARISNSNGTAKNSSVPRNVGSKVAPHVRPPKVINGLKVKVENLKATRDYSFLFSDEEELPGPSKVSSRNIHASHSEARSAQVVNKSKPSNTSRQIPNGREERKPPLKNSNGQRKSGTHMTVPGKSNPAPSTSRKQLGSNNNGSGTGRPVVPKGLPSKTLDRSIEKKIPPPTSKHYAPPTKSLQSSVNKPLPSKNSSIQKQPLQQKKQSQEPPRSKVVQKPPMSSSKPQINRPPPKQNSSHQSVQEQRPKKKPARRYSDDEDDDGGKAISSMIRNMFGYNPKNYSSRDDDDSDMEANFDDIIMEEKRSARIAKKEDEIELQRIEEEERREKLAKKRKLAQR